MIKAEFGIITSFDKNKRYDCYEPEKYECISIDDDIYINDWWEDLLKVDTYFFSTDCPHKGLNRYGITLLPPTSLNIFLKIIQDDPRLNVDVNLYNLTIMIQRAKFDDKYMIHFGI